MSLRNKIEAKLYVSLKERNKLEISTLRLVLAAIKDKDIASRTVDKKEPVGDVEVIKILRKMKGDICILSNNNWKKLWKRSYSRGYNSRYSLYT